MSNEPESGDEEDDDERQPGVTFLVDRGKVRVLVKGMDGYERLVKARLRKAVS